MKALTKDKLCGPEGMDQLLAYYKSVLALWEEGGKTARWITAEKNLDHQTHIATLGAHRENGSVPLCR